MSGGREFQSLGAEWMKALLPMVLSQGRESKGTGDGGNVKKIVKIWWTESATSHESTVSRWIL